MIHLLLPMSGQGRRFQDAGYSIPKPLVPVSGIPMIQRLLESFPRDWPTYFTTASNHKDSGLIEKLKSLRPSAHFSEVAPHTKGPGLALLETLNHVPGDVPVLVSYCDYGMIWDPAYFTRFVSETECDACVISYRGFHAHYLSPRVYAYSRLEGERVKEVREKGSFTENREKEYASSGGYYFRTAQMLKEALLFQIEKEIQVNGEFYTSLTVEALLQMNPKAHVRVFEIPAFFQWGTPDDVWDFEYWEQTYRVKNRELLQELGVSQILMPMAGLGSRFEKIFKEPKPLIPMAGKPMFQVALETFPRSSHNVFVTLNLLKESLKAFENQPQNRFVYLRETPPGQAFTTEQGLSALNENKEVIVTSCDHGIVLKEETWKAFHSNPQSEAAIFTSRGYPGASRRPLSYSYVVSKPGADPFPLVERVSVKKNTCPNVREDHVLVGTFWFKSASILRLGIDHLKQHGSRVNGELYLDSVFESLMQIGFVVRMIPLDGYLCWGDPDAMKETLYWQTVFGGRNIKVFSRPTTNEKRSVPC